MKNSIKTTKKNSTQTIFQGGTPWATPIPNSLVVLVVHYFVQLFLGGKNKNQNNYLLSFSFHLLFSPFTFFAPFFWMSQKCLISQNIRCLIKTSLKTAPKQLFKGEVHEQPWFSIVCLFWWFTIVSNFFLGCKNFRDNYLLSFSFPLLMLFSFYFLSSILLEFSKMFSFPKFRMPYENTI